MKSKEYVLNIPQSAIIIDEDEMTYIDGGADWSHTFTIGNARYYIHIRDIRSTVVAVLALAASICSIGAGLCGIVYSCGNPVVTRTSAAAVIAGVAGVTYSAGEIKSRITVRKTGVCGKY